MKVIGKSYLSVCHGSNLSTEYYFDGKKTGDYGLMNLAVYIVENILRYLCFMLIGQLAKFSKNREEFLSASILAQNCLASMQLSELSNFVTENDLCSAHMRSLNA